MQTLSETELKRWLGRAFYAEKKAKALEALSDQLRACAQGLSTCVSSDTPRAEAPENAAENALIRLAEAEERIKAQREKAALASAQVHDAISLLNDDDLEAVLIHRFLLFHTIEQTAELMHYAPRTIRAKQKRAIEKLCLVMPPPDML